ncbi:MAG: hypothetical protein HRT88_04735, partial [Lentisphaeraceae bacterium]|nr:hypothetical protein [Lentisphaeraceae bacterium]
MIRLVILSLLISSVMAVSLQARPSDVIISIKSQKSEAISTQIKQLVTELSEQQILEMLSLKTADASSKVYSELKNSTFDPKSKVDEKLQALLTKSIEEFQSEFDKIPEKETTGSKLAKLKKQIIKSWTVALAATKKEYDEPIKQIFDMATKEKSTNNKLQTQLDLAKPSKVDQLTKFILVSLSTKNKDIVTSVNGDKVEKVIALALTQVANKAKITHAYTEPQALISEALKKYPLYKRGDNVTIKYAITPVTHNTKSGTIRAISATRVTLGLSKILIKDIIDPIVRDGMSVAATTRNRKIHVKSSNDKVKKLRADFIADNQQKYVNDIIASNEQKGYYLTEGKRQPLQQLSNPAILKHLNNWLKTKIVSFNTVVTENQKFITSLERDIDKSRTYFLEIYADCLFAVQDKLL